MRHTKYHCMYPSRFLTICILVCLGMACMYAATTDDVVNGNTGFSMVINKPKDPYCNVVIRDAAGKNTVTSVAIDTDAQASDIFATVFVDTNMSETFQISFSCTAFQMPLNGGKTAYLPYQLTIYDSDAVAPIQGSPFTVGDTGYTSDSMLPKEKGDTTEESLEFAKLALQLNSADSAPAGEYTATIAVEVVNAS